MMVRVIIEVIIIKKFVQLVRKVRRLFLIRRMFNNWPTLLIKFILANIGIRTKLIAKLGRCIIELEPKVLVSLISDFSKRLIKLDCFNGELYINGIKIYSLDHLKHILYSVSNYAELLGWQFNGNYWLLNTPAFRVKFKNVYIPVLEIFNYNMYNVTSIKDKIVIDVGAYVGDSAIYFALKGAKKVIAIEPHPDAYREMCENIKLNGLEDRITPINAGLASKRSWIYLQDVGVHQTSATYHEPINRHGHVEALTLSDIFDKYLSGEEAPLVLKMDCEGCEYDVILNDYENIKRFDELIIEYHGGLKPLLSRLSRDYDCSIQPDNPHILYCIKH